MHFLQHYFHLDFDHWVEIIATSAGLCCVFLASRENIWNFFLGVINAGSFFFLFHDKKLYADMCLHLVYIGFQVYGFYQWRYGGHKKQGVNVISASTKQLCYAGLVIAALALILYFILSRYTNSTSIPLDATTTAMSLVASWMMAKKWLQNWWLWIIMDVLAIIMMIPKGLYLSSALYALYTIICIYGLIRWRNDINNFEPKAQTA